MDTNKYIAERKLIAESKATGIRKNIVIQIGMPYWIDEGERAACSIKLNGLFDKYPDMQGVDLIQALQIASDIDPKLEIFKDEYEFYWPSGEKYW